MLTTAEYEAICRECDALLLADCTPERVAIAWLHVIRAHPTFLGDYTEVLSGGAGAARNFVKAARNHAAWAARILRRRSTNTLWFCAREPDGELDVLFVSHLVRASDAGRDEDSYFGALPNQLAAAGYAVGIALINHTGSSSARMAGKWSEAKVPRFVLAESLGARRELAAYRSLLAAGRAIGRADRGEKDLAGRVRARAAREALSGRTAQSYRLGEQVAELARRFAPRSLVLTHEGHAWERLAFARAREASQEVRCIGYQHAVLFHRQHALLRALPGYEPNHIMTSGVGAREKFAAVPGRESVTVSVLGSDRGAAPASGGAADARDGKRPACLVLPEGITSECDLLLGFSMDCAERFPEFEFVWRLHPATDFNSLREENPKLRNVPLNITLSKSSLDDDVARCDWALYRGTTAIVRAVGGGLRPVYFRVPGEISVDPLYDLSEWKAVVSTPEALGAVLAEGTAGASSPEALAAKRYCESIFAPLDFEVLRQVVGPPASGAAQAA